MRNRNTKGRARCEQLVSHAVRLIYERGLEHVRATDVTRAAGVSSGLFYWYFRDMDDLVRHLLIEGRRKYRAGIAAAIEGMSDPLECLYVASRESVLLAESDEIMRALAWSENGAPDTPHGAEMQRTVDILIDDALRLLAEGQVQGSIRRDLTPLHLAYFVRGVLHYNITSYYRGVILGSVDELAEAIASFVLRAVCTDLKQAEEIERRLRSLAASAAG